MVSARGLLSIAGSRLAALTTGLALVSALLVGEAHPGRQASGLIAFARADGIYVTRTDGSGIRALRRGGTAGQALDLAWSPDGRKLAFAAGSGIWMMNADGTDLARLVDASPGWARSLSWSPDGRRLAYTTFQTRGRIWVMNSDGSGKRLLARLPGLRLYAVAGIDWSPTADRLAFTTGGRKSRLFLINTDGSGLRELRHATRFAYQPRWAPDGRRIAFTYAPSASGEEIVVIAANGQTQARWLTNNVFLDSQPAWSPDGRTIAFVHGREEGCSLGCAPSRRSSHEIYLISANGTGVTRLTYNQVGEGSPAWQPRPSS